MAVAWMLISTVSAAEFSSIRQLDVSFLVELIEAHPQIQISDAQVASAAARQRRAVMTPVSGLTVGTGVGLNPDALGNDDGLSPTDPLFQMSGQLWFGIDVIEVATYGTRLQQARAEYREQQALRESRRLELTTEVRELIIKISLQEDVLVLQERTLAQMEDNLAIAQRAFLEGTIDAPRFSQASQFASTAALQLAQTRATISSLIIQLESIIGMSLADAYAQQQSR